MSRRKIIYAFFLIAVVLMNIFVIFFCNLDSSKMKLGYTISLSESDNLQMFYSEDGNWVGENGFDFPYEKPYEEKKIEVKIPFPLERLRIDLGNKTGVITEVGDVYLEYAGKKQALDLETLYEAANGKEQLCILEKEKNRYTFEVNFEDAFLVYDMDEVQQAAFLKQYESRNMMLKVVLCVIIDLAALVLIRLRNVLIDFAKGLYDNRRLIFNLSINDFKVKYAGSYLGVIWAFIQPLITILVYWFVFQYGLRSGSPEEGVPFVLWFITGLIPWFFYADAINNGTNSFTDYSYLVKKVKFKISILPFVKVLSAFYVHMIFVVFLAVLYIFGGMQFSAYWIQLIYYSICMYALCIGTVYLTSSFVVFFKDLGQFINIFLQVGMWMTPILWSYKILPEKLMFLMKLNPMFYIVEGYRDSLIGKMWFFDKYFQTLYFWGITAVVLLAGMYMFKKLKPHFSDVL